MPFDIIIAQPRGFCAGVDRAIEIVERALSSHGAPVYVRHEIVHNRYVVENLKKKGAVFVNEVAEIPDGGVAIFSAHGTAKAVLEQASQRDLTVIDAACPLVTKVHREAIRYHKEGYSVVLIGHAGHIEVEGTMGQLPPGAVHLVERAEDVTSLSIPDPERVAVTTQTTLSMDDTAEVMAALRKTFPSLAVPKADDICYATQNRQNAVKSLVETCDVVLVLGARNSSNSNRLREVGERAGASAYLIDDEESLNPDWVKDARMVGVTAGASAPEVLVKGLVNRLVTIGGTTPTYQEGTPERITFPLPIEIA
ncbi:4-hydroxy-3-methylbut-2-enyl diphosphate reductase [bacterium]|nr:4-hydroxy-3-methylbut-2-enyl diphosphate reductase [bacterium]